MSKILYACSRNSGFSADTKEKLNDICNQLVPDNIDAPKPHVVRVEDDLAYAVCMDSGALQESRMSLLLGFLYEKNKVSWDKPRTCYPDGNYALFRVDEAELEVVSDCVGTRTVWYYHDEEIFVASTSQRAIIMFLGTFEFDERVIPWMLSTGSLGPQFSWDKRIKRLSVDSSLSLDKKSWLVSITQAPIDFSVVDRETEDHKKLLADSIGQAAESLERIDFERWVLPLSGGYDSRGILLFIKKTIGAPDNLKAITWGLEKSQYENDNDAYVAKELARSVGVQHKYYYTDISPEPLEVIFDRFLFCSEGRVDHIAGYMDGMDIWKQLHDEGVNGVIRGDEGFGELPSSSELNVRNLAGCGLCSDYKNLSQVINEFGFPPQEMPVELRQKEGEAFYAWRDRLHQEYRIPTILAALSDIKYSYLEQVNPLLSRSVLDAVRSFPDDLRTDKYLLKNLVESMEPRVPFALKSANANPKDILREKECVDLMKSEITSNYSAELFSSGFVNRIISEIKVGKDESRRQSIKGLVISFLPTSIKNRLRDTVARRSVDGNVLAFRVFMIIKMHKMLTSDAYRVVRSQQYLVDEARAATS
ncbi:MULTISPECIES: hypothetical protein [Chromohalobacter]|uniref:Asparagine synthetase domain-containing protein n=1 Tax=Chromohalobacter moromii TaxID=2860329 RepID=A0A9X2X505_9GAMM|nr:MULTISPECIES: hypothetical protein [Chromohalobacter]MCK2047155.1 hypothetical protein [Chromohalobacter moromii]MCT8498594.1 hypothetical protein [Chromohalobacter canadensis]MCT8506810.1 hypothetical protein [Chromohalobacter moromii]